MSVVTVTPTVEPSAAPEDPPRVRLDITDAGAPAITTTTVTRLDPDGRVAVVRTFDGRPLTLSAGAGLLYDYEMPYGAPVTYSTLESPGVLAEPVTVPEERVWLVHPGIPVLSRPVLVAGISSRTRPVQRGIHRPHGRKSAVVQSDGQRKAPEYTLTVRTTTASDRQAIDDLLEDAGTLLLNVPAQLNWGITAEYVSVGDSDEDRLMPYAPEQRRHWQLPVIVVDRPAGGSQAERTFVDVLVDNADFAELLSKYDTFLDLLAGP